MTKLLIILTCFSLLFSCNSQPKPSKKIATVIKKADSLQKGKAVDTTTASDNDAGVSFEEVKSELLSQYNKVERIDTTVVVNNDSLHVHEKYYCLKDNAVVVPKKYLWGGDTTKDFVTHSFVSSIMVIRNKDTIINKIFSVKDFNSVIYAEERQYAILFDSNFDGYNELYDGLVFGYSITIPLTDVGVAAYMVIDKNGKYRPVNDFDMANKIKR
jgi:Domain of unknown function (DUF4738)